MTLRSDATQAIAAALMFEVYDFIEPDNTANTAAEAVLDALLDYLQVHIEEWVTAATSTGLILTTDSVYEALIVALREKS